MVGSRASDNANQIPLKLPFAPASVPFRKQFALRTVVPPYIYIYIYIYTQKRMKKRITSPLSKYAANRLEEREIGS